MQTKTGSLQLYITSYGAYLHVKDALFELRLKEENGSTRKLHYAARKVKSIIFTVAGALSTEAVKLALEHNVDILFSEYDGQPLGRVWHSLPRQHHAYPQTAVESQRTTGRPTVYGSVADPASWNNKPRY